MPLLLICSSLIFIFFLRGCLAPRLYSRWVLIATARGDLCSSGMWFFMEDSDKKKAKKECEEAYNTFIGLNPNEQVACLNAAAPTCRHTQECENLVYSCTFICDVEYWQHIENTGRYESKMIPMEKNIKVIADEMFQNLGVGPSS